MPAAVIRLLITMLLLTPTGAVATGSTEVELAMCQMRVPATQYGAVAREVRRTTVQELESVMKKRSEGDRESCEHVGGIWTMQSNGGKRELMAIPLNGEFLAAAARKGMQSVSFVQERDANGKIEDRGMIFKTDKGWFYQRSDKPLNLEMPTALAGLDEKQMGSNHAYLALKRVDQMAEAFDEYSRTGMKTKGYEVMPMKFDNKMEAGQIGSGATLQYDGMATFRSYMKSESRSLANASAFLNNHTIRVPKEMYDVLKDPEFVRARQGRQYSAMLDKIHSRSRALTKDRFSALVLSLMATDLRERGPCGAVYGMRGREMVPLSPFDGEKPTAFKPSRLDAPQHIFGYAVMTELAGEQKAQLISFQDEVRKRYFPSTLNYLRSLHEGGSQKASEYKDFTPGLAIIVGGQDFNPQRTRIDSEWDGLYNKMGIELARQSRLNEDVKVSTVLNAPDFETEKSRLGLQPSSRTEWEAYDPFLEPPTVATKKNAAERKALQDSLPWWAKHPDGQPEFPMAAMGFGGMSGPPPQPTPHTKESVDANRKWKELRENDVDQYKWLKIQSERLRCESAYQKSQYVSCDRFHSEMKKYLIELRDRNQLQNRDHK